MNPRLFRALVRSLLAASLPLSGAGGCGGTCSRYQTSVVSDTTDVRAPVVPDTCTSLCGPTISTCEVVIQGRKPLTIDCSGAPAVTPPARELLIPVADCSLVCDGEAASCSIYQINDGTTLQAKVNCASTYSCFNFPSGRRPAALQLPTCQVEDEVGALFATATQLEAASVDAFAILAAELRAHGAPAGLIGGAERARKDEVRHARMTAALARRFSACPVPPIVTRREVRSLLQIALENAVEGCVREAYGAFLASWQAAAATDEFVRKVMRRIAPDEVRHAELAFAVDDWIRPQLSAAEQRLVAEARARAVRELLAELAAPTAVSLQLTAGLPPPAVAQSFVRAQAQLKDGLPPAAS